MFPPRPGFQQLYKVQGFINNASRSPIRTPPALWIPVKQVIDGVRKHTPVLDIIRTIYGKNTLITSPHQRSLPRHRVAAESQELEDIVQFFRDSCTELEDYIHSKPSAEDQEQTRISRILQRNLGVGKPTHSSQSGSVFCGGKGWRASVWICIWATTFAGVQPLVSFPHGSGL